jgi:hypothetical protein
VHIISGDAAAIAGLFFIICFFEAEKQRRTKSKQEKNSKFNSFHMGVVL